MPKITSMEQLLEVREQAQARLQKRLAETTQILVGMGTCGIAAGARETREALRSELANRAIEANVTTVGCIGMCTEEPLVDIVAPGEDRITYGNVTADKVPQLIEEHLVKGQVIREWAIGMLERL